jgi:transposase InsO family protein
VLVELCVVEQRTKAVFEVLDGATVTDVARRYEVSRQTVHVWLRKYANEGFSALVDKSSKPEHCPHQMPAVVEARIVELRVEHPDWGPRTIRYFLAAEGADPVPGRSSVHRALVRHRLVSPTKRRRRREDYKRWERKRSMELWQMDVVGRFRLKDGTELKCLTGVDDHSRFCVSARLMVRATARPVCEALKLALRTHGLPRQILTDNGRVFTARFSKGPGPVLFDRICQDNGIDHLLTAPYSPTTTGKVERFHRTLRREFFSKHDFGFATLEEAQSALDDWVVIYNTLRPHQSIGERPPMERFALRIEEPPEIVDTSTDDDQEDEVRPAPTVTRRVGTDGRIRLEGFGYTTGRWLAGEVVEVAFSGRLLEICHRGEIVATHVRQRRPGTAPARRVEPRRMAPRPATTGTSVVRVVDSSGQVSFAGWTYRVGNPYKGLSVNVAIVGRSVQISYEGAVVKLHPVRHDRAKEFGAFSTPNGRPRNRKVNRGAAAS